MDEKQWKLKKANNRKAVQNGANAINCVLSGIEEIKNETGDLLVNATTIQLFRH